MHQRFHVGALQREHADGHAGHPVDVERFDGFEHVFQLDLRPGENQQVARIVAAQRRGVFGKRLENPQHFAHTDITQRHDLHRKSLRQRTLHVAELRCHVAAKAGGLWQHFVDPRFLH